MGLLAVIVNTPFGPVEIEPHQIAIALGGAVAGWLLGRWKEARSWRRKSFLDRINVSLNTVDKNTLRFRTLADLDALAVFRNATVVRRVQDAAKRANKTGPLLNLPKDEYWHFLNFLLNEISSRFAVGYLRQDLNADARCGTYLMCLTCEAYGSARTWKVRAMLIRKESLLTLPTNIDFATDRQATRWKTLHTMAAEYQQNPWKFTEIVLCA